MNIFGLTAFLGTIGGALVAYNFIMPFGFELAVLAAIVGAVGGYFIGPYFGLLFLLPFEGAARLWRYSKTGNWTVPKGP